ncbi:MAG: DUF6166 domain-containing protein [Candidatus Binatia bacterium]
MSKTYTGRRTEKGVVVEVSRFNSSGRKLTRPLRHIPFHSPQGLEWGYQGSGPADLALAILVDHLREHPPTKGWRAGEKFSRWAGDSQAFKHHEAFKQNFTATFADEWSLTTLDINAWLFKRGWSKGWKGDKK